MQMHDQPSTVWSLLMLYFSLTENSCHVGRNDPVHVNVNCLYCGGCSSFGNIKRTKINKALLNSIPQHPQQQLLYITYVMQKIYTILSCISTEKGRNQIHTINWCSHTYPYLTKLYNTPAKNITFNHVGYSLSLPKSISTGKRIAVQ